MEGTIQLEDILEYLQEFRRNQGEFGFRNVSAGRGCTQNQRHVPRIIQEGIQN